MLEKKNSCSYPVIHNIWSLPINFLLTALKSQLIHSKHIWQIPCWLDELDYKFKLNRCSTKTLAVSTHTGQIHYDYVAKSDITTTIKTCYFSVLFLITTTIYNICLIWYVKTNIINKRQILLKVTHSNDTTEIQSSLPKNPKWKCPQTSFPKNPNICSLSMHKNSVDTTKIKIKEYANDKFNSIN